MAVTTVQTATPFQTTSVQEVCTFQTEAKPTDGDTTAGASLTNVGGYTVFLEADAGQTLSGSGTLYAYLYNPQTSKWHYAPDLSFVVPSSATGQSGVGFIGVYVSSPWGRVCYRPNAVGVSAGNLTIYLNTTDTDRKQG